jgi:signal peptidase I
MNDASVPAVSGDPRRPVWAILLSIAATGLGHIYCGRLLKGLILFFAGFAFAPIIVNAANNAASTFMLTIVIGSLLLLLGIFIYAIVDAGMLARRIGRDYQRKEYNRWYIYLLFIVVALSYPTNLAASIREHVLQAFKIPSQSMAPSILSGDRLLLNKARYRIQPPEKGDVVIFLDPDDRRKFYMKRIVALPGESVEIRDNVVYVDDRPLAQRPTDRPPKVNFALSAGAKIMIEDNGSRRYPIIIDSSHPQNMSNQVVPHGRCFVLSDNRQLTTAGSSHFGDSRYFGAIPLADIKGRMEYIYWPALSWSRFGGFTRVLSASGRR